MQAMPIRVFMVIYLQKKKTLKKMADCRRL
jgi:hypothetical protein